MKAFISGLVDVTPLEAPAQPPGIWPSPGHPAHPIAPGGQPPGYWGGVAPPMPGHPIAPGGPPPQVWPGPGAPSHPIYIPVQPPPDSGLSPEHPIYIPVYIWGGGGVPMPTPPIRLPLTEEQIEKVKQFLTGNLPPQPPNVAPVG